MKVFITKYALNAECGIEEKDIDAVHQLPWYAHKEGRDWHRTREGAVVRAEAMRVAKIKSLQKQISKLEKLVFA